MIGEGTVRFVMKAGNNLAKFSFQTLVRFIGTPFQKLFDRAGETHRFLTEQAIVILKNDGYTEAAGFFSEFLGELIEGNYWADRFWKNALHHYNPHTLRGLLIWPGGPDQCRNWFHAALSQWKRGRLEKSMFMLGAAIHIVQDLCQPYHSHCAVLDGHQKYEQWADSRKLEFAVTSKGVYRVSDKPSGWVMSNARVSYDLLEQVRGKDETAEKVGATRTLLSRAQRTTAGFLMFFLEQAKQSGLPKSGITVPDFFEKVLTCRAKSASLSA